MNYNMQEPETDAQRQARLEKLALQRLAVQEAQHEQQQQLIEQQQRAHEDQRAIQDYQQVAARIQPLIPANTEAAAALLSELDSTASKQVDYWRIGDRRDALDKTAAPITALVEEAQGIATWWLMRQPSFNPASPILSGIGMKSPFAPLPQPVTSGDVLQEWIATSPADQYRLRASIGYYFTGLIYNRAR